LVLEGIMISAFDDDPEQTFTAGQSFYDLASFHGVSLNGSMTEAMKVVIATPSEQANPIPSDLRPFHNLRLMATTLFRPCPLPPSVRFADYSAKWREEGFPLPIQAHRLRVALS
jgi:hypothetical protein